LVAGARNHLNLLFDAPELRRWARKAALQAAGFLVVTQFDGALDSRVGWPKFETETLPGKLIRAAGVELAMGETANFSSLSQLDQR
jgi:hypothetical protein